MTTATTPRPARSRRATTAPTKTTTVDSPIGPLLLTSRNGALTRVHMHAQRHAAAPAPDWEQDRDAFADAIAQLDAYFAGALTDFDLALDARGTEFQQRVWAQLRAIPYGDAVSYADLARSIGRPTAYRAVGLANGRNPLAIIIPCHRVIAADGTLGGYGGGLDRKRWLLDHEAAHAPA